MSNTKIYEQPLVFGLDIGTRNVIGTVGYREEEEFIVVAQHIMEHETRAMLDGQIHDIGRVGRTIQKLKEELERQTGQKLTEVCIAAAGRVLKTVTTNIEQEFPTETVVTGEDVHTLDLMGIEKAQDILKEMNDTNYKFYCVGYSVVKYYLNDEPFSSVESHKADKIAEDIIVTFLPEDVVDGLYAAVGLAGLSVANMTLEPIAAINVAIPENYRLLNIALVDIGAGTSDISVTKDGSIIAYGMIPLAGDEITELIVQQYLVDFKTAEYIKLCSSEQEEITYKDIMLLEHTIPSEEVWKLTEPVVDKMTTEVANKIKELNGGNTVSATFIVGGGGKIHGYTEMLAEKLGLPKERVALRGEEVLQEVKFEQTDIKKDPLLVTPIGICLNYYDQRNNFVMVRFNGERVKLYNNDNLTIVDVALQAGFPNEDLFPKRGKELQFTVNGVTRVVRGEPGESASIFMNDRPVGINVPLEPNSDIIINSSTAGAAATCILEQLDEYVAASVAFFVNGKIVRCPKFLEVNGNLELPSYQIQEGDAIETRSFYTVGQLAEFMDVEIDMDRAILVNNRAATMDTLIYENFTIEWTVLSYGAAAVRLEDLEAAPVQMPVHTPLEEKNNVSRPALLPDLENRLVENDVPAAAGNVEELHRKGGKQAESGEPVADGSVEELQDKEGRPTENNVSAAAGSIGELQDKEGRPTEKGEPVADGSVEEVQNKEGSTTENNVSAVAGSIEELRNEEGKPVQKGESVANAAATEAKLQEKQPTNASAADGKTADEKQAVSSAEETVQSGGQPVREGKKPQEAFAELTSYESAASMPAAEKKPAMPEGTILIHINGEPVYMTGKRRYIFVDIFDFYEFDLTASAGRAVITKLNGENAAFSAELFAGDEIELGWKEH